MKFIIPILAVFGCLIGNGAATADPPIRPGDHVAIVGNTFADQLRIHGYLETLLLQKTSDTPISIRNLGWGGDMLTARDRPTNFPTEETTLRDHQTDVIVACFGMGESFAGERGIEKFKADLEAWIESHRGKKYNGKTEVRLVLVSPIACEDLGHLTPDLDGRNRDLQSYTRAMREVAESADNAFIDLFEPSRYLMDEQRGPNLTTNGIHLNQYGYWAISRTFLNQLFPGHDETPPWQMRMDANAKTGTAIGVELADIASDETGLRFRVTETTPPHLPPPVDNPLPPQLEFLRDTLAVENLPPGTYALTVDGEHVATASADQWTRGVAIDASPAHAEAESVRAAVNDKNLQFTYSWKALNQVHIVGERRSSPSGRALPGEVIQFSELAKERDANLAKRIRLATRQWRLSRVTQ